MLIFLEFHDIQQTFGADWKRHQCSVIIQLFRKTWFRHSGRFQNSVCQGYGGCWRFSMVKFHCYEPLMEWHHSSSTHTHFISRQHRKKSLSPDSLFLESTPYLFKKNNPHLSSQLRPLCVLKFRIRTRSSGHKSRQHLPPTSGCHSPNSWWNRQPNKMAQKPYRIGNEVVEGRCEKSTR